MPSSNGTANTNPKTYDPKNPKEKEVYEFYRPENETPTKRGAEILKTREINKGMAFSLHERQLLGVHGLLPPAFMTQEQQAHRVLTKLRQQPDDLARYIQLDSLQDRNEKLFYRVLADNVKELLPIVYTPTVGLACQTFGFNYRTPKGLYITINDNSVSQIYQILCNWPNDDVRAIMVTDGERILGLGDLGCYGMGIPVGKLALYVSLGGVLPRWCLPVQLDVGTDNEQLLKDPYYIGLRRRRARGEDYDQLIENFMKACVKKYGRNVLVQFEDFGKTNAYRLLDSLAPRYCMFNDDVQGTAGVVVAGLLACSRVSKKKVGDNKYLFLGGGAAATGVADLIVREMESEGLSEKQAKERIFLINTGGLVTVSRTRDPKLDPRLIPYAKALPEEKDLLTVVRSVKPDAIIGVSTVAGAFTDEVLKEMAKNTARPIIFPLSNPTTKSECTAEAAYRCTKGAALFASGSPFDDVAMGGKVYKPGQCNNSYIFPGVALGVIVFKIAIIKNDLFLTAARTLAKCVSDKSLAEGRIYPRLEDSRENSIKIAVAVAEESYRDGTAQLLPKPACLESYLRLQTYKVEYEELLNETYDWPAKDMQPGFSLPPIEHQVTADD